MDDERRQLEDDFHAVMTLALPYFAYIARLSRASILEVLRSDYVRTARAKGLSESVIMVKHVLKGALLPVVSYLGPAFAHIVTGSIVVETIFRVPGLGRHFVQSALNRDYTLIMGTVIVYSVILLVMNLSLTYSMASWIHGFHTDEKITKHRAWGIEQRVEGMAKRNTVLPNR